MGGLFNTNIILTELEAQTSKETCQLLGNAFGYCIQLSLGFIAFSALLFKRYQVPKAKRRGWPVWSRDVSKQAFGAAVAHGWNMVFSVALSDSLQEGEGNPCIFYLVNFVVDSIFGCLGNFLVIYAIVYIAIKYRIPTLETGNYGDPPELSVFLIQLITWLWVVTTVKVVFLYILVIPFQIGLYDAASWLMSPVNMYPKVELAIVMIIIPLILNVFVFWVTDNFLMKKKKQGGGDDPTRSCKSWYAKRWSCCFLRQKMRSDEEAQYTVVDPEHDHDK